MTNYQYKSFKSFFNENSKYQQYDHITSTWSILLRHVDEFFTRKPKKQSEGVSPLEKALLIDKAGRLAKEFEKDLEDPNRRLVKFQDLPIWPVYKKLTEKYIAQYNKIHSALPDLEFTPKLDPRSYQAKKQRAKTNHYKRMKDKLESIYNQIRDLDDVIQDQRKDQIRAFLNRQPRNHEL